MSTLITNECATNGWGYIITEHTTDGDDPVRDRKILVTFWVKDPNQPIKKWVYKSRKSLYEDMKVFVGSQLVNYTEFHRSKAFMGNEYIQYYERLMGTQNKAYELGASA